jgi:hypothetical protein
MVQRSVAGAGAEATPREIPRRLEPFGELRRRRELQMRRENGAVSC